MSDDDRLIYGACPHCNRTMHPMRQLDADGKIIAFGVSCWHGQPLTDGWESIEG